MRLFLFLLLAFPARALELSSIRHIDSDGGLSQNQVWAIVQDHLGFIWIATAHGLNRYDGREFKIFHHRPGDPASLSNSFIRSLCLDSGKGLWIGTADGLCFLDPRTDEIKTVLRDDLRPEGISSLYFTALVLDYQGVLWAGTPTGLIRLDPKSGATEHIRPTDGREWGNSLNIRAITADDTNRIWVGANRGLFFVDREQKKLRSWTPNTDGPDTPRLWGLQSICHDTLGNLWMGTDQSLIRVDPSSGHAEVFGTDPGKPNGLGDSFIRTLHPGPDGALFIGTQSGGLSLFDPDREHFQTWGVSHGATLSLTDKNITALLVDRGQNLWAGTFNQGIDLLDLKPPKFSLLRMPGSSLKEVQSVYEDSEKNLWLGTQTGLIRYHYGSNSYKLYQHKPGEHNSLSENQILDIVEVGGRPWIGTYSGGVNVYRAATDDFHHIYQDEEPEGTNYFFKLYKTRSGEVWAGTYRGLERYDSVSDTFAKYTLPTSVTSSPVRYRVNEIFEDEQGRLWAGTEGSGIVRVQPGNDDVRHFVKHDGSGLSNDRINVIRRFDGQLWIGTMEGLCLYDESRDGFIAHGRKDGLPGDSVYAIVGDMSGTLWLSTNRGLVRFEPGRGVVQVYDISDGIQDNDFFRDAGLRRSDGKILFAGPKGITCFNPSAMYDNPHIPPIVLTSLRVFDREHEMAPLLVDGGEITLNHYQNHFSVEFASLDFAAPHKNRYAYHMEGVDPDWVQSGSRNYASYTNLPGGSYNFRVKGCNNDGVWNEKGLTLRIHIKPPFWKTIWFQMLFLLVVILISWGIYRLRRHAIYRQNRKLEALVEDRTREFKLIQQKLMGLAHQSGIFEITHSVLDQVEGQLLNLENSIQRMIEHISWFRPTRMVDYIRALERNVKSKKSLSEAEARDLVSPFFQIEKELNDHRRELREHAAELIDHTQRMRETILVQHDYAKTGQSQDVDICRLVDDAIQLESAHILNLRIDVRKSYHARPRCDLPGIKLLHVLTQVIQNAREAMSEVETRQLKLQVSRDDEGFVLIRIEDTGPGIPADLHQSIFNYGFTTKPDHLGVGLHTCATTMRDLGGSIQIVPANNGTGSAVTLTLPSRFNRGFQIAHQKP